jgi:DNA-directed RNA polymerase specialized sigma24 family protein
VVTSVKRELGTVLLHHLDAAYNFARWAVGHPTGAEDVLEDTLEGVLSASAAPRGTTTRARILGEVRNAALRRGPSREPSHSFSDLIAPPAQTAATIGARAAGIELQPPDVENLRRVVADLSLEQRELVLLRDTEGLSYREITGLLRVPPGAMTSRLWRARDAIELRTRALEGLTKAHDQAPALIDAYIDAEVDITTAATLVQHIAQCRDCADRLLRRSKLVQQIRSVTVCCAPAELRRRLERRFRIRDRSTQLPERSLYISRRGSTAR